MGWTLNEYALTTLKGGNVVAGNTEEEIYAKLGLDYIEPELRENTGEIEAAEQPCLPHLVKLSDIRGDLQMHTTASDGKNSIEEMGDAARDLGYEYIALTDHSQSRHRRQRHGRKAHPRADQENPRRQHAKCRASACSPESKWTS